MGLIETSSMKDSGARYETWLEFDCLPLHAEKP